MAAFPPPTTPPIDSNRGLSPDRAARLERLAQRSADARRASSTPTDDRAARLERLAQRSANARAAGSATSGTPAPTARTRRNHPAKGARAAAFGMSLATTAGLAGLFATMNRSSSDTASAAAVIVSGTPQAASQANQIAVRVPSPALPVAPAPEVQQPQSVDLTIPAAPTTTVAPPPAQPTVVDGAVFRNRWGNVQVEATFAPDGTLTDVVALQTPNDRRTSIQINDYAVPRLTSEALSVQTSDVNTISGATYTSVGYRQSLQSAIDAARAAGLTAMA